MSRIIPFQGTAAAPLANVITPGEDESYSRLPSTVKARIDTRLALIGAIRMAADKEGVEAACKSISHRMGGKPSWLRLKNDFYAVERARAAGRPSWTALYHGNPDKEKAFIARETADFIWGFMERNQRGSKQGFRDFLSDHWRAGKPVPGVPTAGREGTWRDWFVWKWPEREVPVECPPDLPRGWTYENLMRPHLKPKRAELAATRQGIAAALSELPPIPQTRSLMRPLEWVTFDDVRFDFRVHVEGVGKPVDLVGLVAMDICSGAVLGFGLRPVLLREDGSGEKLKARDSQELIVSLLRQWGFPHAASGYHMTIIQENGTATTGEAFQRAIAEATGGAVRFSNASMLGGTVWSGGFTDRAGGNSRAKAWLESLFNPMHNRLADLPGQSGRRYDVAPASDAGRRKELAMLTKAGQRLAVAQRMELRMPYLSLDEGRAEIAEAFAALNAREDHEMEGFGEVLLWRFNEGEPWRVWGRSGAGLALELVTPPPAERAADVHTAKRPETPAERYMRLSAGLRFCKLAAHAVQPLLSNQRMVKLERGQIVFQHEGRQCLYTPYTAENIPTLQRLASEYGEGKPVLAYYAASDLGTIYLTDGAGRWIGELQRTERLARGAEATAARIATKKALLGDVVARVNARSPEVAEERLETIEHNLDVLSNAAAVPVIMPGDGEELDASGSVAVAMAGKTQRTRSAAVQAREDARLDEKASRALRGLAGAEAFQPDGAEDEADDGL